MSQAAWNRTHQILSQLVAALALATAVLVYQEVRLLGFPDGFLSDVDRLRRLMGYGSSACCLIASVWFVSMSRRSSPNRRDSLQRATRVACITAAYAVLLMLLVLIDEQLRLQAGTGGDARPSRSHGSASFTDL